MAGTLYLVDLESVETRYTSQWKEFLPAQLKNFNIENRYH